MKCLPERKQLPSWEQSLHGSFPSICRRQITGERFLHSQRKSQHRKNTREKPEHRQRSRLRKNETGGNVPRGTFPPVFFTIILKNATIISLFLICGTLSQQDSPCCAGYLSCGNESESTDGVLWERLFQ